MFQKPCCLHPNCYRNGIQVNTEVITMRMWFDYNRTRTSSPSVGHAGFSSTPEGSKQNVFSQDRIVLDSEATFPYLWPHKQVLWLPTSLVSEKGKKRTNVYVIFTSYKLFIYAIFITLKMAILHCFSTPPFHSSYWPGIGSTYLQHNLSLSLVI
jgi:hypothetical protein